LEDCLELHGGTGVLSRGVFKIFKKILFESEREHEQGEGQKEKQTPL